MKTSNRKEGSGHAAIAGISSCGREGWWLLDWDREDFCCRPCCRLKGTKGESRDESAYDERDTCSLDHAESVALSGARANSESEL